MFCSICTIAYSKFFILFTCILKKIRWITKACGDRAHIGGNGYHAPRITPVGATSPLLFLPRDLRSFDLAQLEQPTANRQPLHSVIPPLPRRTHTSSNTGFRFQSLNVCVSAINKDQIFDNPDGVSSWFPPILWKCLTVPSTTIVVWADHTWRRKLVA